jgi:hypothetical protein
MAYVRLAAVPARSDTTLVTTYAYDKKDRHKQSINNLRRSDGRARPQRRQDKQQKGQA